MTNLSMTEQRMPLGTGHPDDKYWYEHSYLMEVQHITCKCGNKWDTSSFYLVKANHLYTPNSTLHNRIPLLGPMSSSLPINTIEESYKQDICHRCVAYHPQAQPTFMVPAKHFDEHSWREALRADATARRKVDAPRAPQAAKPKVTLADFFATLETPAPAGPDLSVSGGTNE